MAFFEEIPSLNDDELRTYYDKYFNSKQEGRKSENLIMLNFSLEMFKNKILKLENIYYKIYLKESCFDNIRYPNIIKLYSIAYIKIYLYKTIYFIFDKNISLDKEILGIIKGESKNEFRKVIKLYIFKLINNFLNNYRYLKNFSFKNRNFDFIEDFKNQLIEEKNEILNYYFISTEKKEICKELYVELDKLIKNNFNLETKIILKYLTEENIDIFYSVIANKILSNIDLNFGIYSQFSTFSQNLFQEQDNISNTFKSVISLITKENSFNSIVRKTILSKEKDDSISIDYDLYEIILTSMRFCLPTAFNQKKNNFYYNLLSNNAIYTINNSFIPGIDEPDDFILANFYLLENHLNSKTADHGAYVCSCGCYYEIDPCGFPTESFECLNCKKLIGGMEKKPEEKGYHKMIIREGHLRIFKNIEDKKQEFDRFKDTDELIPNMLLSEYEEKYITPLLNKNNCGIPKIDKITFIQKNKKIRKLSQVGYRLLNFIFYSHLYFSDCNGYFDSEFKKKYLFENKTFIDILKINWELLEEALFEKGILIIQIFLNLIFNKIAILLKNCGEMKNAEERNIFEENIENILLEYYNEYPNYAEKYISINQEFHNTDPEKLKSIILELYNPDKYDEKKYPFLEYFYMTKYPSEENFKNELYKIKNHTNLYPLISSYINPINDKIDLLQYLPRYNKFLNFMINNYSYKISRKEAYNKKLNDEEIFKKSNFKKDLNNFIDVWKKIGKYVTQYKCHQMKDQIFLNDRMPLINFLVDDGEIEKGMYLAGGYEQFIKWQNEFLIPIIRALDKNKNGILYYFNENLKHKIDVQKASENEIIKKKFPDNSLYINFLHLINLNSYRNIYFINDDSKINYRNYNNFIYDFASIEEELGKILLTGKRLFSDNIHFVTYNYEGFRGEKFSTLTDFMNLYPPQKLTDDEKKDLFSYWKEKNKYNEIDFIQLIFSIQQTIYYLTQEKMNAETKLNDIFKSKPKYLNISNDCKNLFERLYKFNISKLFEIFSYIELFCFDSMINNLKDDYKINLKENEKQMIDNYFNNGVEKKIEKIDLASFCRKLISRYLISKRTDNDINPDISLSLYLNKTDLWNLEIINDNDLFEMEINNIRINIPNVKVSQTFELCKFLDPDNIRLKEIKQMIDADKESRNETNANVDRIKITNKKRYKKY